MGYFLLVFAALFVLRELPILGGVFRIPLVGFFLSAMVVSAVVAAAGTRLTARAKLQRELRDLGTVDTPRMRGKLGRLLLASGRAAQAVEPLGEAAEAEPDNVEWHFRLGSALLGSGDAREALASLERAAELSESHAYGGVLMKLAEAAHRIGDGPRALEALGRFERLQGVTPESAFRRGLALRALGQKPEALAAFAQVSVQAGKAPKYQRAEARAWAARALLARLF